MICIIICKICGKEFKDYNGFGHHIKPIHNITNQQYYDIYLKKPNEGICHCENCNNITKFYGLSSGYADFCSIKCVNSSSSHKSHIAKTKEERYGDPNYSNRQQYKQTMLERYNCSHNWSGKARESVQRTWINKYGVDNPWKNVAIQEKCRKTFSKNHNGKRTVFDIPEIQQKAEILANSHTSRVKANKTKEKSGHRSTFELYFKELLDKKHILYEEEYISNEYPYACDFYLKEYDIYVELNNYWMHGTHMFDKNNKDDLIILNTWKEKAKISKGYKSAIHIWTKYDIEKYNIAKKNKLNYVVLYNKDEILQFFEELEMVK